MGTTVVWYPFECNWSAIISILYVSSLIISLLNIKAFTFNTFKDVLSGVLTFKLNIDDAKYNINV